MKTVIISIEYCSNCPYCDILDNGENTYKLFCKKTKKYRSPYTDDELENLDIIPNYCPLKIVE